MNRLACLAALLALLVSSGCMVYRTTTTFNGINVDGGRRPVETIEIENSGWFLFTCLPLMCGDPDHPNPNTCRWFHNTVHLEGNVKVLHARMKERGVTEVANLTSHWDDEKYLVFLLARRAYHTSAVLLEPLKVDKTPKNPTSKESTK